MKLIWKRTLRVMVTYGGSRGFLLICLNAAVRYVLVAIIMSVTVAVGHDEFVGIPRDTLSDVD